MKILIMVLSYDQPPYDSLMQAQKNTWADTYIESPEDEVNIVFYHGGKGDNGNPIFSMDGTLELPITDAYFLMAGKFKEALEYVKEWDYEIIFRTNSSSYVSLKKLFEFAKSLPTQKLYAGWEIAGNAGYNVVSGAGIFLSRDTAEILRQEIDPLFEREEDCVIAEILHKHNIPIIDDKSRIDYPQQTDGLKDAYHIRFKTGNRLQDSENMRTIHKLIHQ